MTDHRVFMGQAITAADATRHRSSPGPWVGAVVVVADGSATVGATQTYGGAHAEVVALAASADTRATTVHTTLEPCNRRGNRGP